MSKNSKKPKSFMIKPHYEGGVKAMRTLIKENMKYPKEAIENKIEGSVKVKYDVDFKGKVIKTKVIKGLGHGCDEEAERLVKLFIFNVEKVRKMKVIFHKNIQINFKLPKKQPKKITPPRKPSVSLQYNVTKQKQKESKSSKSSRGSYSYTISM